MRGSRLPERPEKRKVFAIKLLLFITRLHRIDTKAALHIKATLQRPDAESLEPVGEALAPKQAAPGRPFRDQVGRMTRGGGVWGGTFCREGGQQAGAGPLLTSADRMEGSGRLLLKK